jgi:hypothetical protein
MMRNAQGVGYNGGAVRSIGWRPPHRSVQARQSLGNALRLWRDALDCPLSLAKWPYDKLRLLPSRNGVPDKVQAWAKQRRRANQGNAAISHLVKYEAPVRYADAQPMGLLWRSGHCGLRGMGFRLPRLSRVGARQWLSAPSYDRTQGQQRPIFAGELPMGNVQRASRQQRGQVCKGGLI